MGEKRTRSAASFCASVQLRGSRHDLVRAEVPVEAMGIRTVQIPGAAVAMQVRAQCLTWRFDQGESSTARDGLARTPAVARHEGPMSGGCVDGAVSLVDAGGSVGVVARYGGADRVEVGHLGGGELDFGGAQVVGELGGGARTEDD